MNPANQKYHIISPDGLPLTPEPFASKQAALDYIPGWRDHLRHQGYYAGVERRIPLTELAGYLTIVPETEANEVMENMYDKISNRNQTALAQLMEKAEAYARGAMARFGEIPPTLLMSGPSGESGFCRNNLLTDAKKKEFLTTGRMMCVSQGAQAVVYCASGWAETHVRAAAVQATSGPAQEEALFLVGESKEITVKRILPVQRSDDEEFLGFGKAREANDARVSPQVGVFLSQHAPDESMRREAGRYLAEMKVVRAKTNRGQEIGGMMI
jgi:hypothetical protein